MTTIAVRDGVMAADSRFTGTFIETGKKMFRRDKAIIGVAGTVTQALVFVDWYFDRKKRQPSLADEGEWAALVLTKGGVEYWDNSLRPVLCEGYTAIGSGSPFAMTAMDCGKTAKQAVQMAAKRDPYTGGTINTMTLSAVI